MLEFQIQIQTYTLYDTDNKWMLLLTDSTTSTSLWVSSLFRCYFQPYRRD